MERRKLEQITASLAVTLLLFLTVGFILFMADQFFGWDIFPPDIEKALGFVLASCFVFIASCVLVNVMINLSIIAINSEKLLGDKNNSKKKNGK